MSFDEYKIYVQKYTPEYVEKLSGIPAGRLKQLAEIYADKFTKVVSLWCMGFNQHNRGTWVNNLVYNLHLLTGKISEPGNGRRTDAHFDSSRCAEILIISESEAGELP